MAYRNPNPVVVAVLPGDPQPIRIASYVRELESIEMAAARVAAEQASVESQPSDWSLVTSQTTPENQVYIFCTMLKMPVSPHAFTLEGLPDPGAPAVNGPTPVAVGLIRLEGPGEPTLLGVVRGIPPGIGGVALPGGYVDEHETIEEAAARESREECGMLTPDQEWFLVCSRITDQNRVLIFCRYAPQPRQPGEEVAVRGCVPYDTREVRALVPITSTTELVFPTHQDVARLYLASQR